MQLNFQLLNLPASRNSASQFNVFHTLEDFKKDSKMMFNRLKSESSHI